MSLPVDAVIIFLILPQSDRYMVTDHGTCVLRKDFPGLLDAESATRRPGTLLLTPVTVINRVLAQFCVTANPGADLQSLSWSLIV